MRKTSYKRLSRRLFGLLCPLALILVSAAIGMNVLGATYDFALDIGGTEQEFQGKNWSLSIKPTDFDGFSEVCALSATLAIDTEKIEYSGYSSSGDFRPTVTPQDSNGEIVLVASTGLPEGSEITRFDFRPKSAFAYDESTEVSLTNIRLSDCQTSEDKVAPDVTATLTRRILPSQFEVTGVTQGGVEKQPDGDGNYPVNDKQDIVLSIVEKDYLQSDIWTNRSVTINGATATDIYEEAYSGEDGGCPYEEKCPSGYLHSATSLVTSQTSGQNEDLTIHATYTIPASALASTCSVSDETYCGILLSYFFSEYTSEGSSIVDNDMGSIYFRVTPDSSIGDYDLSLTVPLVDKCDEYDGYCSGVNYLYDDLYDDENPISVYIKSTGLSPETTYAVTLKSSDGSISPKVVEVTGADLNLGHTIAVDDLFAGNYNYCTITATIDNITKQLSFQYALRGSFDLTYVTTDQSSTWHRNTYIQLDSTESLQSIAFLTDEHKFIADREYTWTLSVSGNNGSPQNEALAEITSTATGTELNDDGIVWDQIPSAVLDFLDGSYQTAYGEEVSNRVSYHIFIEAGGIRYYNQANGSFWKDLSTDPSLPEITAFSIDTAANTFVDTGKCLPDGTGCLYYSDFSAPVEVTVTAEGMPSGQSGPYGFFLYVVDLEADGGMGGGELLPWDDSLADSVTSLDFVDGVATFSLGNSADWRSKYMAWLMPVPCSYYDSPFLDIDCMSSSVSLRIDYKPGLSSDKYSFDTENNRALGITAGTTNSDFSSHISALYGNTTAVFRSNGTDLLGQNDRVGTGMFLRAFDADDAQTLELEIVVKGDTSGDGQITLTDLVQVSRHIAGLDTLSGVRGSAGDILDAGRPTLTSLVKISRHIAGIEIIG